MQSYSYDDGYTTCVETHTTLRISSDNVCLSDVTKLLDLRPTKSFSKGEAFGKSQLTRKANGWFYSTKGFFQSRDTRRHLDQIIDAIEPRRDAIHALIELGFRIDICNYWVSAGHGGPSIEYEQMRRLAELKISVWWDVYFDKQDDEDSVS